MVSKVYASDEGVFESICNVVASATFFLKTLSLQCAGGVQRTPCGGEELLRGGEKAERRPFRHPHRLGDTWQGVHPKLFWYSCLK